MGEDALARKLVDEIGDLDRAIAEALVRAGIPAGEKIRVLEYRRPRASFIERLIGSAIGEAWDRNARLPEPGAVYYRVDEQDD
jgi:ClpP class serine protease